MSLRRWLVTLVAVLSLPGFSADLTKEVAAGNTAFAFDLYARLSTEKGNLFFSPYSVSTALGMTWAGARGETANQMATTLHFQKDVHAGLAALNTRLIGKQAGYQLSVANRLFVKSGFQLLDAFTAVARDQYAAPVEQVDFTKEETRQHVNHWVEEQTNQRIKDLIAKGVFTKDTRLALVNAIYFKGTWATEFDKKQTTTQPFFTGAKEKLEAPLMFREMGPATHVRYGEAEGVQVLELPYVGGDMTMVVLLPRARDGLGALEKKLDAARFEQLLQTLQPATVDVWLPRFQVTQSLPLASTLAAMGMPLAFSQAADFSGMTGRSELYIGAVIHKAFVEVNEEGTEAAAATAVVMMTKSVSMPVMKPQFRADHPFLFALRDTKSGSVLFLGRLAAPR